MIKPSENGSVVASGGEAGVDLCIRSIRIILFENYPTGSLHHSSVAIR